VKSKRSTHPARGRLIALFEPLALGNATLDAVMGGASCRKTQKILLNSAVLEPPPLLLVAPYRRSIVGPILRKRPGFKPSLFHLPAFSAPHSPDGFVKYKRRSMSLWQQRPFCLSRWILNKIYHCFFQQVIRRVQMGYC
jgi:hypothetical protein